jgi:integrase
MANHDINRSSEHKRKQEESLGLSSLSFSPPPASKDPTSQQKIPPHSISTSDVIPPDSRATANEVPVNSSASVESAPHTNWAEGTFLSTAPTTASHSLPETSSKLTPSPHLPPTQSANGPHLLSSSASLQSSASSSQSSLTTKTTKTNAADSESLSSMVSPEKKATFHPESEGGHNSGQFAVSGATSDQRQTSSSRPVPSHIHDYSPPLSATEPRSLLSLNGSPPPHSGPAGSSAPATAYTPPFKSHSTPAATLFAPYLEPTIHTDSERPSKKIRFVVSPSAATEISSNVTKNSTTLSTDDDAAATSLYDPRKEILPIPSNNNPMAAVNVGGSEVPSATTPSHGSGDDGEDEKLPSLTTTPLLLSTSDNSVAFSIPSVEKLNNNHYLLCLRTVETKLKNMRIRLMQGDLDNIDEEQLTLKRELHQYLNEFREIINTRLLHAKDLKTLQSLEEFIETYLLPQIDLYELDVHHLRNPFPISSREIPLYLGVVQEQAGPIFKDKLIGPFTIRLLTGATVQQVHSGPIQPELSGTSQRIKRNNPDLENARQSFNENGVAVFTDLKFQSGTFPNLVRLKFKVTLQVVIDDQSVTHTVESPPSKPFIAMTNTGSQWKDAAGSWLKEDCFGDNDYEVSIFRFWNYFQKHFLHCTKQDVNSLRRPLYLSDFNYILNAKFKKQLPEKKTINQKEFEKLWDWIGPALKKIRYQKHLLWLFENGYLAAFVTGTEAEDRLRNETNGTFLIRFSERLAGELVISYKHDSGVRHYLIQPDDTADKKKTLIDFLGQASSLIWILQLKTDANETRIFIKHNKDKVLQKYYKKPPKQIAKNQSLDTKPYDTQLL